ncbi:MAG: hypothetical protein KME42_27525 [Tildeniella nuda ZEHNDER 1965/U140]|nr:hypothetical protein [Tildeniella nuda ZEHNDER 1965/U140]
MSPTIAAAVEAIQMAARGIRTTLHHCANACSCITGVSPAIAAGIEHIQMAARYIVNVLYGLAKARTHAKHLRHDNTKVSSALN